MTAKTLKGRLLDKNKWLRILYVLLFALVLPFLQLLLGVTTLVQIILTLFNEKPNSQLLDFGRSYAVFYKQLVEFQLWVSDHKPFPFNTWPAEEGEKVAAARQSSPATKAKKDSTKKAATAKKATVKKTAAKKPTVRKTTARKTTKPQADTEKSESTE